MSKNKDFKSNSANNHDDNGNKIELLVLLLQYLKNRDLFEELMELCGPIVYTLTNKFFLNGYERSDLMQEARIVLVKAVYRYVVGSLMGFDQYYHMELSNHFKNLVKKEDTQKRKVNSKTSSLDGLVEEAGVHVQGTSSVMTYPENAILLKEKVVYFLDDLSELEKNAFLFYLDGKNLEEISVELDKEIPQITTALQRASAKLKKALN